MKDTNKGLPAPEIIRGMPKVKNPKNQFTEIETEKQRRIVCPFCGTEYEPSHETPDTGYEYCQQCDRVFMFQREVLIRYSTKKIFPNHLLKMLGMEKEE